ncbi:cholestenol Delta-isomerase, partial [Lecanoromycetidae sp. Uapishka_2]
MEDVALNATKAAVHPFYPLGADIVGYIANKWSVPTLLGVFAAGWVVILGGTLAMVRRHNPGLPGRDKATLLWFVLSYFSYNHANMAGKQDFFGQLWKEYSFSDSRYLTSDPFVLCMETVTAFAWGPLSFVVALMITAEHPLRHPLQALVSLGQIYGDILYYATSMFDHYHKGLTYCRPEAYYFWGYYFFMNFIWIVIPGILLYSSISKTATAFSALDRETKKKQTNGHIKKIN